jgi:hypothetical protein
MKDQFEKDIKSLVEEFSYDYDPKAWDALSKKLPKGRNGFSTLAKLAGALVIVTSALTFWLRNEEAPQMKPAAQKATSSVKSNAKTISKENHKSFVQNTTKTFSAPHQQFSNPAMIAATELPVSSPERLEGNAAVHNTQQLAPTESNESLRLKANEAIELRTYNEAQILQPVANMPCKGHSITLDADAINYEDGTPRIKVNAECNACDISWSSNGTLQHKKSRSVELLAFKGQTYTISAQAQLDGCSSTEKIKITANEDYNLLAVNAFNPQSRDDRNARFMPYALTIRNVRFEMLIIDPDNGAVVFKSTDAQNQWDGIDQRNGQLIPAQKAYIWKVVIQDPLPDEKSTYTGTIVRI